MSSNKFREAKDNFFKIKRRWVFSFKNFFSNFKISVKKAIRVNWTWPKKVFLAILAILFVGAFFLYMPFSYEYDQYYYSDNQYYFVFDNYGTLNYQTINFVDALFMSASAFTNTGLSVTDVGYNYSIFGQVIIWILVQIGGFGFISLFYMIGRMFSIVSGKKTFASSMIYIERGGGKISDSSKMIVRLFVIIVFIQILFAFIMSFILYTTPFERQIFDMNDPFLIPYNSGFVYKTYGDYGASFWHSLFLSTSAINNAGFDLFGVSSLSMFRNDFGILIQFFTLFLFIVGGIGFPVIYDISKKFEWLYKNKIHNVLFKKGNVIYNEPKPRFSSFSRICISMFLIVSILSIGLTYATEYISVLNFGNKADTHSLLLYPNINNTFGSNPDLNKNWAIFFNTMSTRSAGFSTVNMSNFSEPTRWIFVFLMFIGTSPSSTGGGIRTTTLAVALRSLGYWLRGMDNPLIRKRAIPKKTVTNSFVAIVFAFILVMFFALILFAFNSISTNGTTPIEKNNWTLLDFIFECSSAFGTTGLSVGITLSGDFKWWSYIPLIILMFIGQMGVTSSLAIFAKKTPKTPNLKYLEQDVRIG